MVVLACLAHCTNNISVPLQFQFELEETGLLLLEARQEKAQHLQVLSQTRVACFVATRIAVNVCRYG